MENNSQEIEEWRSIEGYEGLYQVSSLGRVRSCDRFAKDGRCTRLFRGRVLKPAKNNGGYLQVVLCKDGKQTIFRVHRLVGMAFQDICGEYMNGHEIDHRNTTRTDNRAVNLHWVTSKENSNNPITRQHYSDAKKGEKGPWYGKFGKEHFSSKPIIQFDLRGNVIAEFDGLKDAERKLGINIKKICDCCRGRSKTTHGYIFRYKTA